MYDKPELFEAAEGDDVVEVSNSNRTILEIEEERLEISSIDNDSSFSDLISSDADSDAAATNIGNNADADLALEAIADYLSKSLSSNSVDNTTLQMANVAIESICITTNYRNSNMVFSMEDYKKDPQETVRAALEDLKERAAMIWSSVKDNIVNLARILGEKMNYFKRNLSNMRAQVSKLEKDISTVEENKEAKAKILKPQSWFIDLMYSKKGMPHALEGIGSDVETLIREHTKIATTNVEKYTKWLLSNHKEARTDSKTYGTLKLSYRDFLVNGATEFNRSIGSLVPKGDNMFYRGKELPGNKAFYTSVRPGEKNGISCIGTLADLSFGIYQYDPVSYRTQRLKLQNISAMSAGVWCVASIAAMGFSAGVSTMLSVAAIGSGLYSLYNASKKNVEGTGIPITIEKDMVFKTLTVSEIKRVISEVKHGLDALSIWYTNVFEKNWKQKELDKIISSVTGIDKIEVHNNSSFRALKRYCMALLNLMSTTTTSVHVYAFRTYSAMLNYANKSIRQYK